MTPMVWRPTTKQLAIIAELGNAHTSPVKAAGRYVDVLSRRKSLKGPGMMDPDVTMSRDELAQFMASLRELLGELDEFAGRSQFEFQQWVDIVEKLGK